MAQTGIASRRRHGSEQHESSHSRKQTRSRTRTDEDEGTRTGQAVKLLRTKAMNVSNASQISNSCVHCTARG